MGHRKDPNTAAKEAGYTDYDFLDKDAEGSYPPGTMFEIAGEQVDVSEIEDIFAEPEAAPEKPKPQGRLPERPTPA